MLHKSDEDSRGNHHIPEGSPIVSDTQSNIKESWAILRRQFGVLIDYYLTKLQASNPQREVGAESEEAREVEKISSSTKKIKRDCIKTFISNGKICRIIAPRPNPPVLKRCRRATDQASGLCGLA